MTDSPSKRGIIALTQRPRVLIVDDAPDNLKLLSSLFDSSVLELSFAKNGIRAQKLIELSSFELAVLDINLPDIDGFNLAERIRELQPDCELIFCSAHNDRETRERGFLIGASDFIEKPYDLNITAARLRIHIERILLRRRLANERERRNAIISNIHDAVITVNADEIIVDWNQGAARIFSASSDEMVGKPLSLLFPDEAKHRTLASIYEQTTPNEQGALRLINEMRAWKGASFMAELSLSQPYELEEQFATVTIRRIAETVTLKQRVRLMEQALDGLQIPYMIVTYEGVILERSAAFDRLDPQLNLGCGSVGTSLGDCMIRDAFERIRQGDRLFSLERPCRAGELQLRVYADERHRPAYLIQFELEGGDNV